ncbi:MAG: repeat-associated core domain protein, partial [Actinobacteria bacterium]|nr:repeat-associated core domain protein [Actinomycetota bacterium]
MKSGYMNISYRFEGNKNTVRYGDDEQWVFEKDASGNRRKITGPWGGAWEMVYENGRLISKSNPHGGITKYAYNQNGLLKSFTDPMNQTTQYVYHQKWPLPVEIHYPAGEVERYAYDEKGSLTGFTDRTGRKATIAYYPNGLIKQQRGVDGTISTYKYNEFGLPTQITNSVGATGQIAYDARGNLQKHTDPSGVTTEIKYTPADLPEHVLRGGIVQLTAEYDDARTLVGLHESGMASYKMAFDQSGNISNARTSGDMMASYKRDSFGNIIEADIPGRGPARFTYRNGSLIQATDKSGGIWQYTYDKSGKLASHQDPSGIKTRFVYNAAGFMTEK